MADRRVPPHDSGRGNGRGGSTRPTPPSNPQAHQAHQDHLNRLQGLELDSGQRAPSISQPSSEPPPEGQIRYPGGGRGRPPVQNMHPRGAVSSGAGLMRPNPGTNRTSSSSRPSNWATGPLYSPYAIPPHPSGMPHPPSGPFHMYAPDANRRQPQSDNTNMSGIIDNLAAKVQSLPGIPNEAQQILNTEFRLLRQEYAHDQEVNQAKHNEAKADKERLEGQVRTLEQKVKDLEKQLEIVTSRSNVYLKKVDTAQQEVAFKNNELKKAQENTGDHEVLECQNAELMTKIAMQNERLVKQARQLKSAGLSISEPDPFVSHSSSVSTRPSFNTGLVPRVSSNASTGPMYGGSNAPPNAPRGPRRRPQMGAPPPNLYLPELKHTEPGTEMDSPTRPSTSTALVPIAPSIPDFPNIDDGPSQEYVALFVDFYSITEGWANIYSKVPISHRDSRSIASTKQALWTHMTAQIYPARAQDSHVHVGQLLDEPDSHHWLVMRLIVAYFKETMLKTEEFGTYSSQVASTLRDTARQLDDGRGLTGNSRQRLISRQSHAVQSIREAPNYETYRMQRLQHHTNYLRDMLAPLLDAGVDRNQAGQDLGLIIKKGWELSAKILSSHLTFVINFPETSAKFIASSMHARDAPNVDPMQLQIKQKRLKLVITPVVTMRDDRGTTINAKNIHKADVLTMN